jgi:hypothetical protein
MLSSGFTALVWLTCVVAEIAHRTVDALPPEWEVSRLAQRLREHLLVAPRDRLQARLARYILREAVEV